MDSARFRIAIPQPCSCCNRVELQHLQREYESSEEDVWFYHVEARTSCNRCERKRRVNWYDALFLGGGSLLALHQYGFVNEAYLLFAVFIYLFFRKEKKFRYVQIPIPASTVGSIERAIHSSSVAEKGSAFRAHGNFVHHLSLMDMPEVIKQSLVVWAPLSMMGFMEERAGVTRTFAEGQPRVRTEQSPRTTDGPGAKPSAVYDPSQDDEFSGNPDVQGGAMLGTQLNGDEYGQEDRVIGDDSQADTKILARQIGPDLIPTEVFQSTKENLEAGLAKRVKPLPFNPPKKLVRRIEQTVTALITNVFTTKKIKDWREQNPEFTEMHSKKWSAERFRRAFIETLSEVEAKIEQEFQVKVNEALPAKGKAPRPIIQTGDRGQVMMLLPVKCFEDLLFDYFESASIKHVDKAGAMARVAEHLRIHGKDSCQIVEGDGSAWDACCNAGIRGMTENRILEHVIEVLGEDAEVPAGWMRNCLEDMQKERIKGKAKVDNKKHVRPLKVMIASIRQSGHRGTSAFNYLINLVCWLSVLCGEPAKMVRKKDRKLPTWYQSAADGKMYQLKYAFEGDDSAISTTEELGAERIESLWTSLGFRMKLKYAKDYFTFTGFDFLLNQDGPTGAFCPEIARNVASSSWTCSSEAKSKPEMINTIGAAAMLSRAENFKQCGPMSRYFAELGLAHVKISGDFEIVGNSAVKLGIQPCESISTRLQELSADASVLTPGMRRLSELTFGGFTRSQEANLLSCTFDSPDDVSAKYLIPRSLWDPKNFEKARR